MEEETNIMKLITGPTMRSIVNQANELGIQKEDIISINIISGQIYLTYYG